MVCLDFLKRNLRKLLLTRVYNGRLLKPSLCLLSDVHYHAADVLFWVFLRTADATRSQLSSECCVVDVYRFCEAYWWSLAVWHDRDGEHWCRVICVAICWIDWRLFADRTGAFKLFWGVNWHRLSNDLERPLTVFSRSHHCLMLNISQTATDTALVTIEGKIGNRTQAFEWHQCQWPWVTSKPDFKDTILFNIK